MHLQQRLPLERFVTERIGIGDIEEVLRKMHSGKVLRSVVIQKSHRYGMGSGA